jgi:5-methyltetrahydropteroyltriglutamate--homocysteine methyltransferase
MTTTIIGFPRIGEFRDLKFTTEKYFRNEIDEKKLTEEGKLLRKKHWELLKNEGLDTIPSNDFSFYDTFLDTAVLFNILP